MTEHASDADIARAVALHRDGELDAAATVYRAILESAPDHSGVLHNLGVVLAQAGSPEEALALFDSAIVAAPDYLHAHVNRGGALQTLGRLEDAAAAYSRALALQPDLYSIALRQALVLLALGRRADAMEYFAITHRLRREEKSSAGDRRTCRLKIAHDAAQFRHLAAGDDAGGRFAALATLYQDALNAIDWPQDSAAATDLPASWRDRLADSYNRPVHVADAPEIDGPALNPALQAAAITAAYDDRAPGITMIDYLLTADALDRLRRFLLDSTIWYDFSHIGGFLAAYLEDGMACPLLLQIVDELRHLLPDILGPHQLQQAWAFKCLTGDKGIDVHADAGAVNLNLWITPEDSNLEHGAGGLVMHRATPPADWALSNYDRDIAEIRRFLADNEAGTIVVPYGENRAGLFRSDLFHESDRVKFRPGFENHRINITLLFGDQGG